MKSPQLRPSALTLLFLLAIGSASADWTPTGWKYAQAFPIAHEGLLKIPAPLDALDHAQADLRDLRIIGPEGNEVPFTLLNATTTAAHWVRPEGIQVTLAEHATIVTIHAGDARVWDAIQLESPSPRFMKSARVEASPDGTAWETWTTGAPFFRQDQAEKLSFALRHEPVAWLRITLDDPTANRIVITQAQLLLPPAADNPTENVPVQIAPSGAAPGETVLTLQFPAAHLDLDALEFDVADPLFSRRVRLAVREFHDGAVAERSLMADTIYRIGTGNDRTADKLRIPLRLRVPARELIVHIENGDSPPLRLRGVAAQRQIVFLAFAVPAAGRYTLWSGNPQAAVPHYDLESAASALRAVPPQAAAFETPAVNRQYQAPDLLGGLALSGAKLDPSHWSHRRAVQLAASGVQALELDYAALSTSANDLGDLRIVRGDEQIPYLVDRAGTLRPLPITIEPAPDAQRPSVSRWKMVLPAPGAAAAAVFLESPTPLFDRRIQILETRQNANGDSYELPLGTASWRRDLHETPTAKLIPIYAPGTNTLWIETENGDNPPISLEGAGIEYPLVRLIFRADRADAVSLLSGNPDARAPRYDLALVADALIASEKSPATLAAATETRPTRSGFALNQSALLWVALSLVVLGLLAVVAKLLPKNGG